MRLQIVAVLGLFFAQTSSLPTATIEGVVVRIGTNQPIPDVRVMLTASSQTQPAGSVSVVTDSEGRFVMPGIDPGQYRIMFAAEGYSRMFYGQRVPTGIEERGSSNFGTLVTLTAGQRLQGLGVALTPTGGISGRVRSSSGVPAVNVPIQLLRATYSQDNQRSFQAVAGTRSDDRGEYRLYWITPGRYYLAFGYTPGSSMQALFGNADMRGQFGLTYYPRANDIGTALPIDVGPAADLSGTDMVLEPLKLYRIRGRAIDQQTGRAPASARAALNFVSFSGFGGAGSNGSYDPASGVFELRDVAPGTYLAGISVQDPSGGTARPVPVTVVNSDVDGLVVTVMPMLSIPVNISVEGRAFSSIPNLGRWGISLREDVDNSLLSSRLAGTTGSIPSTDGSSRFNNVLPGRFRLHVFAALPPGLYVKEAEYKGKDTLHEAFQISASDPGSFSVILGTDPGQINGTIRNDSGLPVAGMRTVLVPDLHREQPDFYMTANADGTGQFTFRDVAPGDYKLFAWEAIEPYAWYDPDVIKRYETQGKAVHVSESSNTTADLRLIP